MRFDQIPIGAIFAQGHSSCTTRLFLKKSKSSAYVLDPITLDAASDFTLAYENDRGSFCKFSQAVICWLIVKELKQ